MTSRVKHACPLVDQTQASTQLLFALIASQPSIITVYSLLVTYEETLNSSFFMLQSGMCRSGAPHVNKNAL